MRWYWVLAAVLGCANLGCAGLSTSGGGPATDTTEGGGRERSRYVPAINLQMLEEGSYPTQAGLGGTVQLHNGKTDPPGSGDAQKVSLMPNSAFGDLNGDDVKDAAVVLITDTGSGSVFYELIAVLNQDGSPTPLPGVLLGDRIRVNAVGILSQKIFVDLTRQAPADPMNAPTLRAKESYQIKNNDLVRVSQAELTK